jgi:DNA-binding MarR family transcriptional regulator
MIPKTAMINATINSSRHLGLTRANAGASVVTARSRIGNESKSSRAAAVLQHIRELFRVSQQHFKRVEARCGVSGVQVWAAAELKARPGMTISELASALSIHLSTASNLLDRLEGNGLARRERGGKDQRVVRAYITPAGNKMLRSAPKPVQGVIPDALGRMPSTALARLDQDLEALLQLARVRDRRAAMKPLAEP